MKKLFFVGALTVLFLAACSEETAIITKEEFNQLQDGMTYDEVKSIVGGKAKSEHVNSSDESIVDYTFDAEDGSSVVLYFFDGALGTIVGFDEDKKEETTEETPTEPVETIDWQSKMAETANGSGTETEKFDAVMLFANDYTSSQEEAEQFRNEIIAEYNNGNYLKDITNSEYMLSMIFKTRIVETHYLFEGSPTADFAFDMQQNLKYTYRGVDAVDSEAVRSNEEQMNKALSEIK